MKKNENNDLNVTKEKKDLEKKFKKYLKLKDRYTNVKWSLLMYIDKLEYDFMCSYIFGVCEKIEYFFINLTKFLEGDTDFTEQKPKPLYDFYGEVHNKKDYIKAKNQLNNEIQSLSVRTVEEEKRSKDILKYVKEREAKRAILKKKQEEYLNSEEYKQKELKIEEEERIRRERLIKRDKILEENFNAVREKKDLEDNFKYFLKLKQRYDKVESDLIFHLDKLSFNYLIVSGSSYVETIEYLFKSSFKFVAGDTDYKDLSSLGLYYSYGKINNVAGYLQQKADLYNNIYNFAPFVDKQEKRLKDILKCVKEIELKKQQQIPNNNQR